MRAKRQEVTAIIWRLCSTNDYWRWWCCEVMFGNLEVHLLLMSAIAMSFVDCISTLCIGCICQRTIDCQLEWCDLLRVIESLCCARFVNCSGVTFMSLLICTSNDSIKAYPLLLRNWFSSYSLFKLPNLQYTRDWLSQRCKNVQEIDTKIRPSNPLSNASLEWAHAPLIYYKYFSVKNPTTLLGLSDQISQIVLAFLMN